MDLFLQYLLPHHYINKLAQLLANCEIIWIKNFLINCFLKFYPSVNMQETTQTNPLAYKNYNDFFTRKLHINARSPDQTPNSIISPADGFITQYGDIKNNTLLNVKNTNLSLTNLLASTNPIDLQPFSDGKFITIYLAPHNYHRIHMPFNATLEKMLYIPGKLFSVNTAIVEKIPNLFTNNERVISIFNSEIGKITIILVGAMIVGSIVTSWHGQVTPIKPRSITNWNYPANSITLKSFQEMGLFKLGSTVILLLENNKITFSDNFFINKEIKVGETIATIKKMG
ncbi:MAG: archaetidylserine decarboxylase [Gammaproteobacteria bacterium]|jgi:phosphatidylserine decarboxylase